MVRSHGARSDVAQGLKRLCHACAQETRMDDRTYSDDGGDRRGALVATCITCLGTLRMQQGDCIQGLPLLASTSLCLCS